MENNFIINIKNFNLSYGSIQLFKDFNFQVEKGSCAGIFGPTGTGKTSLLNKIVNDYLGKYSISYVFQDNKLLENYTVRENIIIPLKNILNKDKCEEITEKIIKLLNLSGKENNKVEVLSGGEHQRVNIGRAFAYAVAKPVQILLMDEPFSAQDEVNRLKLMELTKKICKQYKITSVIVSHNRDDLEKLCDFVKEL